MIAWTDIESTGFNEREGHLLEVAIVITDDDLNEVSHFDTVVRPVGVDIDQVPMDQVVKDMHEKNGLFAELRTGGGVRRCDAESLLISFLVGPRDPCGVPLAPDGEGSLKPIYVCGGQENALAGTVNTDYCVNCKKKRGEHAALGVMCPNTLSSAPPATFTAKQVTLASQTPLAGSTVSFDRRWLREHMPKLEAIFSYRSIDVSSITELARRWAPAIYEARPKQEAGAAHRALADVRESIAYLKYFRRTGFIGLPSYACKACSIEAEIGTEEVPHPIDRRIHTCDPKPL